MFKDKFKESNDSIHADEELINKVLALKNSENRTIHHRKRIVSYIPAAAAAVLVISAAAASIPFMTKTNDDSGVIYENTVTESSDRSTEAADISPDNELPEVPESTKPVENDSKKPKNSSNSNTAPSVNSKSTAKSSNNNLVKNSNNSSSPKSSSNGNAAKSGSNTSQSSDTTESVSDSGATYGESGYYETVPIEEYNLPSAGNPHSEEIPDNADNSGISKRAAKEVTPNKTVPDTSEERVVLSMNAGAYAETRSAANSASLSLVSEIGYAEWSYRDYFDYLGRNLSPTLPSDFSFTGHSSDSLTDDTLLSETFEMAVDEYGTPVFDNRIFVFDGTDGRYAGIQTSKDTNTAMTYLTDSNFTLSKIGSSYGVLIGTIEDCRAYMVCDGVSYVINAVGLDEEELKTLLLSVAEG